MLPNQHNQYSKLPIKCQARSVQYDQDFRFVEYLARPILISCSNLNIASSEPKAYTPPPIILTSIGSFASGSQESFTLASVISDLLTEIIIANTGTECNRKVYQAIYALASSSVIIISQSTSIYAWFPVLGWYIYCNRFPEREMNGVSVPPQAGYQLPCSGDFISMTI